MAKIDCQPVKLISLFLFSAVLILLLTQAACSLSLEKAQVHYLEGQRHEAGLRTAEAASHYRRALVLVEQEIQKQPSASAYLLRGLIAARLQEWDRAGDSFRLAAAMGEEKASDWSREVILYGLALSFENQGLTEGATRLYRSLMEKGKFEPVVQAATGRYLDNRLAMLEDKNEVERKKIILELINTTEKILKDYSTQGYYHYLLSQVYSYEKKYRESFEEAVMAHELGLPSEKLNRDNDRQIIFCYYMISQNQPEEISGFIRAYHYWIKKWNWLDETTPGWKRR